MTAKKKAKRRPSYSNWKPYAILGGILLASLCATALLVGFILRTAADMKAKVVKYSSEETERGGTDSAYEGISVAYTRLPGAVYLYNSDFGIETYFSPYDKDGDGIDDQTEFVTGAKKYLANNPQYDSSSYYEDGYVEADADGVYYGVCTDVVAFAFLEAGYNLRDMVYQDIQENPENYSDPGEWQIAFRRVRNLYVFFHNYAESLTLDPYDIEAWQAGDIVVFVGESGLWDGHIAIVSDRRAEDGVAYVLHHATEGQTNYEEDILTTATKILIGHYRYVGYDNLQEK